MAESAGQIDQIRRTAGRALRRTRTESGGQQMPAVIAENPVLLEMNLAAIDLQVPSLDKKLRHLASGSLHESGESRS